MKKKRIPLDQLFALAQQQAKANKDSRHGIPTPTHKAPCDKAKQRI